MRRRPIRIFALVGCCGEKLSESAPARKLYRSPLFRASLAYAERVLGAETYVLSARHGLLPLDRVIEPYDLSLRQLDAWERAWWVHEVERQLAEVLGGELDTVIPAAGEVVTDPIEARYFFFDPHVRVVLLAGALYRLPCPLLRFVSVEEPLAGMGIGERLRWLKESVAVAEAAPVRGRRQGRTEDAEESWA